MSESLSQTNRVMRAVGYALRLRCTICGKGTVFRSWVRMAPHCDRCGYVYEREPGYFLGSIYVNYGVTGGVTVALVLVLMFWAEASTEVVVAVPLAFAALFPMWFNRYARCLWMAFDLTFDPPREDDFVPR